MENQVKIRNNNLDCDPGLAVGRSDAVRLFPEAARPEKGALRAVPTPPGCEKTQVNNSKLQMFLI